MRFLADECTDPAVAWWLRRQGHKVFSVYEEARGMEDEDIIRKAFAEDWILVTNDKGFREKVYRERHLQRVSFFYVWTTNGRATRSRRCDDCLKVTRIDPATQPNRLSPLSPPFSWASWAVAGGSSAAR